MNRHEPVAIVGAACRLPAAPNVDAFWHLLIEERDAIVPMPSERSEIENRWPARPTGPDVRRRLGGYIDDIDKFDARFFTISPHVAARLDPHQRLLVENVWDAVEDAGIPTATLAGSNTGVYASCPSGDYWDLLQSADIRDVHTVLSSDTGMGAAGLIAHHLDLRGPCMGVNAFCASSLLAVHFGYRAVRDGEVDVAIVCAANLQYTPARYLAHSADRILSPAGRCRFGDRTADGYVPSDGVVSMVLKPLSRAVADGDRIYATIIGSGVRGDGRSGGTMLTPGVDGQVAMLRAAYRDAGVDPSEVDYVEAHGSGTRVGDPVELAALSRVLGDGRTNRCLVGSVKSNIGHTEFSAGLAGLLKTALAIRHRTVPATLHVSTQQPMLDEPNVPLALATRTVPWPRAARRAVAGVSSFGVTGTNVHVVLTEAPVPARRPDDTHEDGPHRYLLPLSAHCPAALTELAGRYADLLSTRVGAVRPYDVCRSAGARRSPHAYRAAFVAGDRPGLVDALRLAVGVGAGGRVTGPPKVVFVFPGQGSQWPGMCRQLLTGSPAFATAFAECSDAVAAETGWSPAALLAQGGELSTVDRIQPTLWATQVALARQWEHWGVTPDLLIGQSMGEIAAAVAGGALSVADGAAVVCRRSALLAGHDAEGAMWSVQLGADAARTAIRAFGGRISVAAMNSPNSTVLSGDPAALATMADSLRRDGVCCRRIPVDYASHGPSVEPLRPALTSALASLRPRVGRVPIHSTAFDRLLDGSEFDGAYWADNLRRPVHLAAAIVSAVAGADRTLFVEVSPHPVLIAAIEDCVAASGADAAVVHSQHRDEDGWHALLTALGTAFTYGCEPDWDRVYPGGSFAPLPGYPWQGRRFWVPEDARGRAAPADAGLAMPTERDIGPDREHDELARDIAHRAAEVLALSPDEIDPDLPLSLAGLDSVLAVRLRARMKQDLDLHVPARDLLGGLSPIELARMGRVGTVTA